MIFFSEDQVFHENFNTDQDEEQPANDLHFITEKILKLFAKHDTGNEITPQTIPMMSAGMSTAFRSISKLTLMARTSMLVARESAIKGKSRITSTGAFSSFP